VSRFAYGQILIVLPSPSLAQKEESLLQLANKLAKGLGVELEIIFLINCSLTHYGEVDTLASFKDKKDFISYVCDLEREEQEGLKKRLENICPDSQVTFLEQANLATFLKDKKDNILFTLVFTHKKHSSIFSRLPSFIKTLEKIGLNILYIRDINTIARYL